MVEADFSVKLEPQAEQFQVFCWALRIHFLSILRYGWDYRKGGGLVDTF